MANTVSKGKVVVKRKKLKFNKISNLKLIGIDCECSQAWIWLDEQWNNRRFFKNREIGCGTGAL